MTDRGGDAMRWSRQIVQLPAWWRGVTSRENGWPESAGPSGPRPPENGTFLALDNAPGLRCSRVSRWTATVEVAQHPALSRGSSPAVPRRYGRPGVGWVLGRQRGQADVDLDPRPAIGGAPLGRQRPGGPGLGATLDTLFGKPLTAGNTVSVTLPVQTVSGIDGRGSVRGARRFRVMHAGRRTVRRIKPPLIRPEWPNDAGRSTSVHDQTFEAVDLAVEILQQFTMLSDATEGLPEIPESVPDLGVRDLGDVGSAAIQSIAAVDADQREQVRRILLNGASLLLRNSANVHYTQDLRLRWEGISNGLRISRGDYPHHGDCSSTLTWLYWNALYTHLGMSDVVNGQEWRGGYTGTMLQHGRHIEESDLQVGDSVIYGNAPSGTHVAMSIGSGMVFSHGGEGGPYKLRVRYRNDVLGIRRYF